MSTVFAKKPPPEFVERFKQHVEKTGEPESFEGLYYQKISKDEEFVKLAGFVVSPKKRRDGKKADCPMCSPNKYFEGLLVYLPRLEAVAAIGHCCANKENMAKAKAEYDRKVKSDIEIEYLLQNIPLVPSCVSICDSLMPCATQANITYREFKRSKAGVWKALSGLKKIGGRLYVTEEISRNPTLEGGPSGLRGRGSNAADTRDIDFGALQGLTVFNSSFDPVGGLKCIMDLLSAFDHGKDEDDALSYVADLESNIDELDYAFDALHGAGKLFRKLRSELEDYSRFFLTDNLARLAGWMSHELNNSPLTLNFREERGIKTLSFRNRASAGSTTSCNLVVQPALWDYQHDWPIATDPITRRTA